LLTLSTPAIGLVDVGEDGATVRLSSRGDGGGSIAPDARGATAGRASIEVPATVPLHQLLAIADVGEPDHLKPDARALVFSLGVNAVGRARARGLAAEAVLARFEAIGIASPTPPAVAEVVAGLGATRSIGIVPVSAALLVEDPGLRAQLLSDGVLKRMLLDLDAGPMLLLRADADEARLSARLTRHGVRLERQEPSEIAVEPAATDTGTEQHSRLEIHRRRSLGPSASEPAPEDTSKVSAS
jgi:hypothetical protein